MNNRVNLSLKVLVDKKIIIIPVTHKIGLQPHPTDLETVRYSIANIKVPN